MSTPSSKPPPPTEAEESAEESADEPAQADPLADPLAELIAERDQYRELAQRVQADFENFRKQQLKRQTELIERAAETLIERLLPVLDNFDLAQRHDVENETLNQLWGALWHVLNQEGLTRIDDPDAPFDPTIHDAVQHLDGDSGEGPVVVEVMRSGYRWKDRVLRAAMVAVRGG